MSHGSPPPPSSPAGSYAASPPALREPPQLYELPPAGGHGTLSCCSVTPLFGRRAAERREKGVRLLAGLCRSMGPPLYSCVNTGVPQLQGTVHMRNMAFLVSDFLDNRGTAGGRSD